VFKYTDLKKTLGNHAISIKKDTTEIPIVESRTCTDGTTVGASETCPAEVAEVTPPDFYFFGDLKDLVSIVVIPGPDSIADNLKLSWEITGLAADQLTIQLKFKNPENVMTSD